MKFTINSTFSESRDVQSQIMDAVEQNGYGEQTTFSIKLALEEAMINAIKHGNKLDPSKMVLVEAAVNPMQVEISIEDQGPGFDRSAVPDPTAEENLCKCSGRGILLIESYMDEVSYSKQGRRVKMIKRNERAGGSKDKT